MDPLCTKVTSLKSALFKATVSTEPKDIPQMLLSHEDLPPSYIHYKVARQGVLSNQHMAENGFPDNSEQKYKNTGRKTGYIREFGSASDFQSDNRAIFAVASVAHLFDTPDSVSNWINDVFYRDFQNHVGKQLGHSQNLLEVNRLKSAAFFDESLAIKAIHETSHGLVSSTIIDFRVGRILGVVFISAFGTGNNLDETTELGIALEKKIVTTILKL